MINNFRLRSLTVVTITTLVLASIHFCLIQYALPKIYSAGPWWAIYLFLFPLTIITILTVSGRYKKDKTAAGRTYFVWVFLKMFGSIVFLWPWLFNKTEFSVPLAHQFLSLFFILLFVEVSLLVSLLNGRFSENSENDKNQ